MILLFSEILLLAFINSLIIIGVYYSTDYTLHPHGIKGEDGADKYGIMNDTKMVFWRVRYWAESTLGDFWSKPICGCVQCMASLHSIIPFTLYCLFTQPLLLYTFPFYAFLVSAIAKYLNQKYY